MAIPSYVACQGAYWSVRRVCNCGDDISSELFFGTGYSAASVDVNETTIFAQTIAEGNYGVMTHFWVTAPVGTLDDVIIRYYVDGEEEAAVAFSPPLAAGIGFGDSFAPRGQQWVGMAAGGSNQGRAYYVNIPIPFESSIFVTAQRPSGFVPSFFMVRVLYEWLM